MKRIILCVLVVIILLGLAACTQPAGAMVKSEKPRVTSPEVEDTDLALLAKGNSTFAFGLYQALGKENGNLFCSPYSI